MGFCTSRLFVLTICILQVVATIERQIFDFLGFMWIPILADFLNIIFVIFGFFGAHQYRPKYVISYCVWSLLWIAWNIFVICFYLNVGILQKDGSALNLGTDSISWWNLHGIGCHPVPNLSTDMLSLDTAQRHVPVEGCLLNYEYVEVLHAAVHLFLAALGSTGGAFLTRQFLDDDDTFDFLDGFETKSPQHTALRPTYVRVASNASPLRSSTQRLTLTKQDGQHRSLSLNRGNDSIRLCRSELAVDRMGKSRKESSLEHPKIMPRNERRPPRPMSLYASTRFD